MVDGLCVKAICYGCTWVYFNLQWSSRSSRKMTMKVKKRLLAMAMTLTPLEVEIHRKRGLSHKVYHIQSKNAKNLLPDSLTEYHNNDTINHNHSTNDWSFTGTTDNQTHHHRNTALACIWTVRGCGTTSLAICQKRLSVNSRQLMKFVSKNWCCVHVFQTWNVSGHRLQIWSFQGSRLIFGV